MRWLIYRLISYIYIYNGSLCKWQSAQLYKWLLAAIVIIGNQNPLSDFCVGGELINSLTYFFSLEGTCWLGYVSTTFAFVFKIGMYVGLCRVFIEWWFPLASGFRRVTFMITSWYMYENAFRIIDPLPGECTGRWWPVMRWFNDILVPSLNNALQIAEFPVIPDALTLMSRHWNA